MAQRATTIAFDVMGGDHGPLEVVRGAALLSLEAPHIHALLVGDAQVIEQALQSEVVDVRDTQSPGDLTRVHRSGFGVEQLEDLRSSGEPYGHLAQSYHSCAAFAAAAWFGRWPGFRSQPRRR